MNFQLLSSALIFGALTAVHCLNIAQRPSRMTKARLHQRVRHRIRTRHRTSIAIGVIVEECIHTMAVGAFAPAHA